MSDKPTGTPPDDPTFVVIEEPPTPKLKFRTKLRMKAHKAANFISRKTKKSVKRVGRGANWLLKKVGRAGSYVAVKILALVGVIGAVVFDVTRYSGRAVGVVLVLGLFLAFLIVAAAVCIILLLVIKAAQFVYLVLKTPWLLTQGKAGREVLKVDWSLFLLGLHPRNLHRINPANLAREGLDEYWAEFFSSKANPHRYDLFVWDMEEPTSNGFAPRPTPPKPHDPRVSPQPTG